VFEVSLNGLTESARDSFNDLKGALVGKALVMNELELPTRSTPLVRNISEIGLPSSYRVINGGRSMSREVQLEA